MNSSSRRSDDRFWTLTVDKTGNGFAIIRFLPKPIGENDPWVEYWDHGFQGPTGLWYIENSRTSLGPDESDPVSEFNTKLWNSTNDDKSPERAQAREQKRRLHYISNIYIVEDQANPENEGKVFLFKYGKKIFKKLEGAMEPEFKDEKAFDPFHFFKGANFKLKAKKVDKQRNYDSSSFDVNAPLFEDEDKVKEIYKAQYSLKEFLDPSNFKSYADLKKKLEKVLALNSEYNPDKEEDEEETKPTLVKKSTAKSLVEDDDDFDIEHFKSLAS